MKKNYFVFLAVPIALSLIIFSIFSTTLTNQNIQEKIINQDNFIDDFETIESEQIKTSEELLKEIDEKYDEIQNNKEEYMPKERIWQSSGPFKIDRDEYVLGEKIFMIVENIDFSENGEIVFLRPLNSTHYSIWKTFPFDGMQKTAFNLYFEPMLNKRMNICSANDLIGDWIVFFKNTEYEQLEFSIINKTLPGMENDYAKIC